MAQAIRKHTRDFIAVALLLVIGLAATIYIVQKQRLRIPVLEEKPFELRAEFENAQGVVAGQGQTVNVAGVRVGDVQSIEVEDGLALVTFAIDRKYLPIYRDATILLRPRTGLQDMFFQMDPGTKSAGEVPEDDSYAIQASNTAPTVNLDQVLEALDSDTQAYLRLLLVGAGEGLEGRAKDLGELLGGLGPINRSLDRLNTLVAQRDNELARLVHNLNILTDEIGNHDDDLNDLIIESNKTLSAIANQGTDPDPDVARATAALDATLRTAEVALADVNAFAQELGPTFAALSNQDPLPPGATQDDPCGDLKPQQANFACSLVDLNSSLKSLAEAATPALRNQIRPFVRAARPAIDPLRGTAQVYTPATPKLTILGKEINRLGNMAAYNPRGQEQCIAGVCPPGRDEGYLYWAGWLGHIGNTVFANADAHGLYRRIYFTLSCSNAATLLGETPLSPIILPLSPLFAAGGPCNP